jgi:hypothetical protein
VQQQIRIATELQDDGTAQKQKQQSEPDYDGGESDGSNGESLVNTV